MTSPAVQWFLDLLDAVGARPAGKTCRQCPAHHDASPSLSIGEGRDGQVLLRCHRHPACAWSDILAALSLPAAYLWQPPPVSAAAYAAAFSPPITFPPLVSASGSGNSSAGWRLAAIHDYGLSHRLLRERCGDRKRCVWETRTKGAWIPGLLGMPMANLPLYRESDVRRAVLMGEPVLLMESESSVDALSGWYGCTWAGGASSVQVDRIGQVLAGYSQLLVLPDHDEAGLRALDRLRDAHLAPHVLLGAPGEDARDLFERVGRDQFTDLVTAALATDLVSATHKNVPPPRDRRGPNTNNTEEKC